MSKSRLEKFLYALYSLDSSDLPKPLSRIEELYKCLVTGEEAPTFKPLSRVEKYLMVILGGYDVDSLPNPLSRVEVLLHKLATGDDNLDDFKSFLSEHEELLAEIIRNGGVGGNIDIEYVLYTLSTEHNTLYNTAEKPVKSAILKGNTLVNVNRSNFVVNSDITGDYKNAISKFDTDMKASTTYTVIAYSDNQYEYRLSEMRNTTEAALNNVRPLTVGVPTVFTTNEKFTNLRGYLKGDTLNIPQGTEIKILIIEGDHSNENIPYFEGMQSVKMPVLKATGKNLCNRVRGYHSNTGYTQNSWTSFDMSCKPNTTYTAKIFSGSNNRFGFFSGVGVVGSTDHYKVTGGDFTSYTGGEKTFTITTGNNDNVMWVYLDNNSIVSLDDVVVQVEESPTATTYEPHKSNILTVNEEVELRGIGDAKDELDLLTGEVVENVGEVDIVSKSLSLNGTPSTFTIARFYDKEIATSTSWMCNKCNIKRYYTGCISDDNEGIFVALDGNIYIKILSSKLTSQTVDGIKELGLKIQYKLLEKVVKTVDLSVVNQDGNNTKLSTFDDLTHVTLSSEGLILEAELEVATKNEEDLEDTSVYTVHTLSEGYSTLYNTAEKPVKSAILKGQTLVNLAGWNNIKTLDFGSISNNVVTINFEHYYATMTIKTENMIKQNTTYTFIIDSKVTKSEVDAHGNPPRQNGVIIRFTDGTFQTPMTSFQNVGERVLQKIVFTIQNKEIEQIYIRLFTASLTTSGACQGEVYSAMLIEGDYTNTDIPYFEGMKSVQMPVLTTTGKNLWYGDKDVFSNGITTLNMSFKKGTYYFTGDVDTVYPDGPTTIVFSNTLTGYGVGAYINTPIRSAILKEDCNQVKIYTNGWSYNNSTNKPQTIKNLMLSDTYPTSYEPYKSNILTVNEEIELRGIGDAKDELDLTTGELTQRVGEFIVTNDYSWYSVKENENTISAQTSLPAELKGLFVKNTPDKPLMCDKIKYIGDSSDEEHIRFTTPSDTLYTNTLNIWLNKNKLTSYDSAGIKQYIQSIGGITVQGALVTEVVKTVDLSVVNQDGNDTELSTFNDITHVTLSSEGLIPEAELEVAEKVPEVAANMLGISREQEVINTATNEQSENVDSTMIATTEIYEELL